MAETRDIRVHNQAVQRTNAQPAEIPPAAGDLKAIIDEYNQVEADQAARLATIWATMAAGIGGTRQVTFAGSSKRWTSNDFPREGRLDLVMSRAMDGMIVYISDWSL